MATRLQERYQSEIAPALEKEFSYPNVMQIPRLHKIVLNIGLGEATREPKAVEAAVRDITIIAGQRPIVTKARKSIAQFRLRTGMPIGVTVTLRGDRMYEFLDRFVSVALPRVRDFRGISDSVFDGRGNATIGLREQLIFPEIDYDKIDKVRGMEITMVTSARTDEESKRLLELLGLPFERVAA
jgi:large subunit ribosomal protein L5